MSDLNRIILTGRLVNDPQLKFLPSQTQVCNFRIASTHIRLDKARKRHRESLYIDCILYGPKAEILHQYTAAGSHILIEGRLLLVEWKAKSGQPRHDYRIVVTDFTFMPKKQPADPYTRKSRRPIQQQNPTDPQALDPDAEEPF